MSDLTAKFLKQLQNDLYLLADDSCPICSRLKDLAGRLDVVENGTSVAVSWDKEQGRFVIDASHSAVKALINSRTRRRTDMVFLLSTLATLLNREQADISDEHERAFHAKLLRFAMENAQGTWSA